MLYQHTGNNKRPVPLRFCSAFSQEELYITLIIYGVCADIWHRSSTNDKEVMMLTVCMFCQQVRRVYGNWRIAGEVEQRRMRTEPVSHGICPACVQKHYGFLEGK